jgi:hypothetical protein
MQELEKGARSSRATFPHAFDQANLTDRKVIAGDGDYLTGTHFVHHCHAWHNSKSQPNRHEPFYNLDAPEIGSIAEPDLSIYTPRIYSHLQPLTSISGTLPPFIP